MHEGRCNPLTMSDGFGSEQKMANSRARALLAGRIVDRRAPRDVCQPPVRLNPADQESRPTASHWRFTAWRAAL